MHLQLLLLDHKGKVHRRITWEFFEQTTFTDLRQAISRILLVKEAYQDVLKDGLPCIGTGTLVKAGMKNGDVIEVKHQLSESWATYTDIINRARVMTSSGCTIKRKELLMQGRDHLLPLLGSKFFVAFTEFLREMLSIDRELNHILLNTRKYMRRATKAYFTTLFGEEKSLELLEKPLGSIGQCLGAFAYVREKTGEMVRSYYVKTSDPMGNAEISPSLMPITDLTEIFVYHLISLIGVGAAEVHIIPDSARSEWIFIATELTPKKVPLTQEAQRRLTLLRCLLCLDDLSENKNNFGVVAIDNDLNDRLRIVDFKVNIHRLPHIPRNKDVQFYQNYLNEWQMLKNIDKAYRLTLENPAIKGNTNVTTSILEAYYEDVKIALTEFVNNRKLPSFA